MTTGFAERVAQAPSRAHRMRRSLLGQGARNPTCPATPRLDGRTALVTGGGRGIGLETSRGLAARGAEVFSASRREPEGDVPARFVSLDLADLRSVAAGLDALARDLGGRRLDVVVANAGLWPSRHRTSAQGFESAFATNVLGHHALVRGLQARDLLAPQARVVVVTGDIYVLADDCTPDFRFRGRLGGQRAYCRSKLGNLWLARELARRHPELRVHAVHPGVVASGLGGGGPLLGAIRRALLLSCEAGAQTPLYCATQPGLASGAYYHNTLGRVELPEHDPAADDARAAAFFDLLDALSAASSRLRSASLRGLASGDALA